MLGRQGCKLAAKAASRCARNGTQRVLSVSARRVGNPLVLHSSPAWVFGGVSFSAAVAVVTLAANSEKVAFCLDEKRLEECDALFEKRGLDGNLSKCLKSLEEMFEDSVTYDERAQLCFRITRAAYNLLTSTDPYDAELNGSKEKKKELAEKAVKFAEEAREVAPEDFRSHYWCGIAIQAYGDHVGGTKYTLERLNDIRSHFEQAAQLNPNDGTTLYCLGSWCYSLSDLGWVSRKLASTLFATPPTSTFQEALDFFLEAERVEPDFWNKNALMIAKSYEKVGNKPKAAEWALITSERPCTNAEDDKVKKEALEIYNRTK